MQGTFLALKQFYCFVLNNGFFITISGGVFTFKVLRTLALWVCIDKIGFVQTNWVCIDRISLLFSFFGVILIAFSRPDYFSVPPF